MAHEVLCLNLICPLVVGVGTLGHQARVLTSGPDPWPSGLGEAPAQQCLGTCSPGPGGRGRRAPARPFLAGQWSAVERAQTGRRESGLESRLCGSWRRPWESAELLGAAVAPLSVAGRMALGEDSLGLGGCQGSSEGQTRAWEPGRSISLSVLSPSPFSGPPFADSGCESFGSGQGWTILF